jgi:hypothetical protein
MSTTKFDEYCTLSAKILLAAKYLVAIHPLEISNQKPILHRYALAPFHFLRRNIFGGVSDSVKVGCSSSRLCQAEEALALWVVIIRRRLGMDETWEALGIPVVTLR